MTSLTLLAATLLAGADGNRLAYLDELNPYYPHRDFPKLITPQWVGEDGVEAVVILGIDDMRGHAKWEHYLRPILDRLKKVDGRAPVSIMTCKIDPKEPHLQKWLKEGVSLECHTVDHPCPLLGKMNLKDAKSTYDRCVDQMFAIPGSRPVAFRTPCCDSLNTLSPRFFAEIFNKMTDAGRFLTIDTSVFCLLTPNDPALPRELVLENGRDRFRKYLPADRTFVNYIEDYPYPYVIGNLCWEFPCMVPSDWAAQHLHKPNNPQTVEDWKAALDAVVIKQGVFCLVFHPHGWIRAEQVNQLIDYSQHKYGKKVKFLTFHEAEARLSKNVLGDHPLRNKQGQKNDVFLSDINVDGYLDVVFADRMREWSSRERTWVVQKTKESLAPPVGRDEPGKRWRDVDGDGVMELVIGNDNKQAVFTLKSTGKKLSWKELPFSLPPKTIIENRKGRDGGLRFRDLDEDGDLDIIFSNHERYGLWLFESIEKGWSRQVLSGIRSKGQNEIPPFVRADGTNNGVWIANRHIYWQNEFTGSDRNLKDLIDRRSFNELLKTVEPKPKSPEMSWRSIKARPGFVVELVASEPLVMDPVAFEWGPDGKLWVVEMADYPLGLDDRGKPGGRVKYLEDLDGDGKYDKATLFLDGVGFPTDVMPWRGGVLVTAAPDIFYAEDTDGDGRADVKRVLYTGFGEGNQQHRVNGLRWGLDNWIYLANGDSGGRIKSVKTGKSVNLGARDLRIRPDEGLLDLQAGRTQHGRCRDDWGSWFGANNATPGWHYALADHYLRRNPHVAIPSARHELTANRFIYPRSRPISHWEGYRPPPAGQPGKITSACGHCVYRDELFGPRYGSSVPVQGGQEPLKAEPYACHLFMSEVVHNLVHHMVLHSEGTTFTARHDVDESQSEFLASSDSWFRPTTLKTGPDGSLWIADMYRLVIEHPKWIDDKVEKKLNLRAGHDRGRIYRVYPIGKKPRPIPRLDKLDTAGLVAALDSPSGWQRDLAQQMLIWRGDKKAVPLLEKLATQSKRPKVRLHALCTLDGMTPLSRGVLAKVLADPHPGVRRHAVRWTEPMLRTWSQDKVAVPPDHPIAVALLKLADDPDPQVRLQLAYTLGEWKDARAGKALNALAFRRDTDANTQAAILSSAPGNLAEMLTKLLAGKQRESDLVPQLLGLAVALNDELAIAAGLEGLAADAAADTRVSRFDHLFAFLDGLARHKTSLKQFHAKSNRRVQAALKKIESVFAEARRTAADGKQPLPHRIQAVALLGWEEDHKDEDVKRLLDLLKPQSDMRTTAADALSRLDDPKVATEMFARWKTFGPSLRGVILYEALSRPRMTNVLLEQLRKGTVPLGELDAATRQRLQKHPTPAVRAVAEELLGNPMATNRSKIIAKYRPTVRAGGDATRGAVVYKRLCANCHRLGQIGHEVGPDLTALTDRSAEAMLAAVLDPSRAVESKYQNYIVQLTDGRSLAGLLHEESGGSITLIAAEGKKHRIARADIDRLESTGKSLMPEGIEKDLSPRDLADVFEYLKRHRKAKR